MSRLDPFRPFTPVVYSDKDAGIVAALKAMSKGEARPDQQTAAFDFIVQRLSGFYDLSYRPNDMGGDRDTAFAEGRRYVGGQILKAVNTPSEILLGTKGD